MCNPYNLIYAILATPSVTATPSDSLLSPYAAAYLAVRTLSPDQPRAYPFLHFASRIDLPATAPSPDPIAASAGSAPARSLINLIEATAPEQTTIRLQALDNVDNPQILHQLWPYPGSPFCAYYLDRVCAQQHRGAQPFVSPCGHLRRGSALCSPASVLRLSGDSQSPLDHRLSASTPCEQAADNAAPITCAGSCIRVSYYYLVISLGLPRLSVCGASLLLPETTLLLSSLSSACVLIRCWPGILSPLDNSQLPRLGQGPQRSKQGLQDSATDKQAHASSYVLACPLCPS